MNLYKFILAIILGMVALMLLPFLVIGVFGIFGITFGIIPFILDYKILFIIFILFILISFTLKRLRRGSIKDKIMDSSVFVDGRVYDLIDHEIIEGRFVIPHFIIEELHRLSDSKDGVRRAKGRRSLEVISALKKLAHIDLVFDKKDYSIKDVDTKLVLLAKERGAKILTTDFNLAKVANIRGVETMNINFIGNLVKKILFPNEEIRLDLVKAGEKPHQAVGYLEDGTMVVVEGGSYRIGFNATIVVSATYPTAAGRIVFGKMKND